LIWLGISITCTSVDKIWKKKTYSLFSGIPEEPVKTSRDRVIILLTFFIFNVLLIFLDIGSDIWNGIDLISRGDVIWGGLTLFVSSCPFLLRFWANFFKLLVNRCKKKDLSKRRSLQMKLKESWRFSPIFHPFEWVLRFVF
jgi:hypothetical protein